MGLEYCVHTYSRAMGLESKTYTLYSVYTYSRVMGLESKPYTLYSVYTFSRTTGLESQPYTLYSVYATPTLGLWAWSLNNPTRCIVYTPTLGPSRRPLSLATCSHS